MNTRETGKIWEDFACVQLQKKGYKLLSRNWTCHWGELDIVAAEPLGKCLVFVEVKYLNSRYGNAYEAVNFRKIAALKRAANYYIQKEKPSQVDFRFDILALTKFPGRIEIQHFEAVDQEW